MRAKLPDTSGFVVRDGVKLHYEIYGDGAETMVFMPPWSIVHSRVYKAQVPYFSERFRCIVFDGRGNGRSDRPEDVVAYTLDNYVADALAVMDATNAGQAVVVGLSFGGLLACVLAAHHPERVKAAIAAGTISSIGPANYARMAATQFTATRERYEDWEKFNRHYWLENYPDFAEFFIRNICTEPHSTKQIEDCVGWGREIGAETLMLGQYAAGITQDETLDLCVRVRCPVLVIVGDQDAVTGPGPGIALAAAVRDARLVTIEGGGHIPDARDPVLVNLLIRDFVAGIHPGFGR
jgi:pimeloyl-ACP methyl ester carboxylesterase